MFIGIDGGGTKTDFLLTDMYGNLLNRIRQGSSNPVDVGIEQSANVLRTGIEMLLDGYNKTEVRSVYGGIAGCGIAPNQNEIKIRIQNMFLDRTIVDIGSDALNLLYYYCGNADGAVLICGTGCIGFVKAQNMLHQVGGCGYLIDRGGSGYDYGRDALYHAFCDLDGRGPHTVLTEMLQEEIGDLYCHTGEIYYGGKSYIASLAPLVFKACQIGDRIAQKIVEDNCRELAKIVDRMCMFQTCSDASIITAGGMFHNGILIYETLQKYVKSNPKYIEAEVPQCYGAVLKAAINANISDLERFRENLNR